ncbi:hypothetical protein ACFZAB_34130 [Streptomyces albogriseolus]|nr:hypothetical protein [Streptomyces viridodiastaticus]MCX4618005.1 hypothetical protein [Streptomyces viridodiastaticus]MCX4625029.1 hypothetical protein [Streptomyces viridodiastaticus]
MAVLLFALAAPEVMSALHVPDALVIALCIAFALLASFWYFSQHSESRDISESRARVREAERDVEGALGGTPIGLSDGEIVVGRITRSGPSAEEIAARQERRDLALSRLWALTQARLTLYHDIATKQARRSFLSAQASMIIGFVMLTVFVYLALKVSNTAGAIVAGGLGAVSAALAGFISKTFVKSQETAAEHLKAYFDQPLEFSRYLAAERLLADANLPDEQRAEVVAALVQTVAAGPGGPAPAADPRALLEQLQDLVPGQR